jgi:hypothetical protein
LHPFGYGAANVGFVAIPSGTVDVTIPGFKSGEDSVITFL